MQRVIVHWSEGRRLSNDTDREHYHFLIEQDANGKVRVIRGDHSVSDNSNTSDGDYAAHTLGCNTGSIGVAMCGMMNCVESPYSPGPVPITEAQWELMEAVVAELCLRYDIPVSPQTTLSHGEVYKNLGIRQRGKWDTLVMPWEPTLSRETVASRMRAGIQVKYDLAKNGTARIEAPAVSCKVVFPNGVTCSGDDVRIEDGDTMLALRTACTKMGWEIVKVVGLTASVKIDGVVHNLPIDIEGNTGFVVVRSLAYLLGMSVGWDKATKTVSLTSESEDK